MKRRNPKKSDSFDFIKASPMKTAHFGSSIILRDHQYKYRTPQINIIVNNRYQVQLPKKNTLTEYKKKKKLIKQQNNQQQQHQNKLLLLNYHNQKQNDDKRPSKQQKNQKKYRQYTYKKFYINNQIFIHKRIFIQSILSNVEIKQTNININNSDKKKKFFIFVQNGNNSRMIKQILRKRNHICFILNKIQANLVWTRFCDYQISKFLSICEDQNCQTSSFYQDQPDNDQHRPPKMLSQIVGYPLKQQKTQQLYPRQNPNTPLIIKNLKIHNHLTNHHEISDKKCLLNNLIKYCLKNKLNTFELVPVTYQFNNLQNYQLNQQISDDGYWFIKPGEDTNRGNGISIALGRKKIKQQVDNLLKSGKTALVQKYVEPLLYRNRKFDIRCYALVVCFRGDLKVYWYKQGYIRTCSKQFSYDISDIYAHLTNDAVQKKHINYGKYEQSNKLSFGDIEMYLRTKDINFKDKCQQMKKLVIYSIKSVQSKLKGEKNQFNFEIFGYDFLLDKKGKIWLIEINTNPCFQFTGSLTSRVIGHMIDNTFKISLDCFIYHQSLKIGGKEDFHRFSQENKYQWIL